MTIFSINSGSFGDVTVTGIVSASTLKGDGSQITSVSYDNIASKPTLISSSTQVEALLPGGTLSSSAQVDITNTTGYDTFSGSLATIDTAQTNRLNTIESFTGSYATTGSNTFTGAQTFSDTTNTTSYLDGAIHIAGGMSVRQDVRISGSMTINGLLTAVSMSTQYVTSSQYVVGTSRITLNDDDNVRFAGLSIIDSGSSSPTSASIFWDSLQHRFIYENLSGSSYNSSIIMAGPKHTGTLGDEVGLTDFRVPVAHGSDHIDSRLASSSIRVDFPSRLTHVEAGLYVTGSVTASSGINGGTSTLSSLIVDGDLTVDTTTLKVDSANNRVGIGTVVPDTNFHIVNSNLPAMRMTLGSEARVHNITGVNNGRDLSIRPYRSFDITAGSGTTEGIIDLKAYEYVDVYTGASYTFSARFDANGNLGLGRSPTSKLDVYQSATNTTAYLTVQNNRARNAAVLTKTTNGGFYTGTSIGTDTLCWQVYDETNGERMRITSAGNVGIGTNSPNLSGGSAGSTIVTISTSTSARNAVLELNGARTDNGGYTGYVRFFNNVAATPLADIQAIRAGADTTGSLAFATTNVERMRIDESGKVGIGIASPVQKLHIEGNAAIGTTGTEDILILGRALSGGVSFQQAASLKLGRYQNAGGAFESYTRLDIALRDNSAASNYNTNTTVMTLTNAGNVGIGTTSPDAIFHVAKASSGGVGGQIVIDNPATSALGNTAEISFLTDTGASGAATRNARILAINEDVNNGAARIELHTWDGGTSAARLTIKSGGNVGIGTTSFNTNGGVLQVKNGVSFPATQVACSDANTLDDYEEGTYTPTLVTDTGTPTYSYQEGYYTKIGQQVFGGGIIGITNSSSLTGQIRISIPFTINGATYGYTAGATSDGSGWTFPLTSNNFYQVNLQANNGVSHIGVVGVGISAAVVNYTSSGVGSSWYIRYQFSIKV